MRTTGRFTMVFVLGLLLALGGCGKKEEGGGGGGAAAKPAEVTFTPEQAEQILTKAEQTIDKELAKKAMSGTITPEDGMKFSKMQEDAVKAVVPDATAWNWAEWINKDGNEQYQMRWIGIITGTSSTP